MTSQDIAALKRAADEASDAFDAACRPHYCDGRWGAYRAYERGDTVPASVEAALDAYHAATQAFYVAGMVSAAFSVRGDFDLCRMT